MSNIVLIESFFVIIIIIVVVVCDLSGYAQAWAVRLLLFCSKTL